jgi:transposase-like protein
MSKLVSVGSFCPNEDCPDYGETERGNIIRYGKTGEGRQRFQCKTCTRTFNERKGTLFYNRKTDEEDILECLALLAEGVRISSIHRAKGIKEDTILSFWREAALHAEQIEARLLDDDQISQVEIDGLWTYVGRKEAEKTGEAAMNQGNIGVAPRLNPTRACELGEAVGQPKRRRPLSYGNR